MPLVRQMQYMRIKKGLSRADLAEKLNRTRGMVKQYEHGIRPIPIPVMQSIKHILDIDAEKWNPLERIEISEEEYIKYRKFLRMGAVEYTNTAMIYFLGKHFPVKSMAEVHSGIMERKRAKALALKQA